MRQFGLPGAKGDRRFATCPPGGRRSPTRHPAPHWSKASEWQFLTGNIGRVWAMAISRANAQAAITVLVGGGALNFSQLDEFNSHMTEKHFSKATAQATAQNGAPQSYFKRSTSI